MHNNGLGRHYTIVCADTPDKYSSRVMEFDENLRFSFSIEEWELLAILESMKSEDLIEELWACVECSIDKYCVSFC